MRLRTSAPPSTARCVHFQLSSKNWHDLVHPRVGVRLIIGYCTALWWQRRPDLGHRHHSADAAARRPQPPAAAGEGEPTHAARRLFMVVERFRGGDPRAVYERFRARGRMLPDPVPCKYQGSPCDSALSYGGSWVDRGLALCYQVMEVRYTPRNGKPSTSPESIPSAEDADSEVPIALRRWMAAWEDLTEFDLREVVTSAQAAALVAAMGSARRSE